jgi:lysophospholipase L1-like esterase
MLNGALFGVVLLFAFSLLEAGARLYLYGALIVPPASIHADCFAAHPERGWAMRANATLHLRTPDFDVTTQTNSRGMNDEEHPYPKEPGVFRIVLLGDSFMFGREVRRDRGLPALVELAAWGKRVEVINLGAVAYGTIQEYLYLMEEGLQYQPDLVLLSLYPLNDICDNSEALNARMWGDIGLTWGRPYITQDAREEAFNLRFPDYGRMQEALRKYRSERVQDGVTLGERLALFHLAARAWVGARGEFRAPEYDPQDLYGALLTWPAGSERGEQWDAAWQDTALMIRLMKEAAAAHDAAFAMFAVPGRVQVEPSMQAAIQAHFGELDLDWGKPQARLAEIAATLQIPLLDLLGDFRSAEEAGRGPFYSTFEDMHWNGAGHQLACDVLVKWMRMQGLVPMTAQAEVGSRPVIGVD